MDHRDPGDETDQDRPRQQQPWIPDQPWRPSDMFRLRAACTHHFRVDFDQQASICTRCGATRPVR